MKNPRRKFRDGTKRGGERFLRPARFPAETGRRFQTGKGVKKMLATSVNTDYNNDLHDWEATERQLRCIAEAGFSHVQWIHDWEGEYLYSPSEMEQARDALKHYHLIAHTIHASEGKARKNYTSSNSYLRQAGVDLLKNRISFCSAIGAQAMVLHMQLPYRNFLRDPAFEKEYYEQVFRSFDEVRPFAEASGVRIALENLLMTPRTIELQKFERMFDRYGEEYIGLCFDSGHASIMFQPNYYELLERFHSRLIVTHLQDTDSLETARLEDDGAVGRADAHRPPFTGVLDWDRIAYWVARSPLELPADFEIGLRFGSRYPTQEEEVADLRDVHDKSLRFHRMVLEHTQEKCS